MSALALLFEPGPLLFLDRIEIATFRCCIPVDDEGRAFDEVGEPLPLEARRERCPNRTSILVGSAPTCEDHVRVLPVPRTGDWNARQIERLESWLR